MKILITGITGFAGSHLAELVLQMKGMELFGIERPRSDIENIARIRNKIKFFDCDIKDASNVRKILENIKPDKIFHLAAQTFVPTSWNTPSETLITNIIGQLNIFEAVRDVGINPFIQIACSSEEYGFAEDKDIPIKEDAPLNPLSPYGVSKVGQDLLGYQYHKSYGLNIVRTRGFNHSGPRRGKSFVCSNFAYQIARVEKGLQENTIHVGNLSAIRDFLDVRDMVKAYWVSLEKCKPGDVYNICSGKGRTIKEILDILLGLTKAKIDIKKKIEIKEDSSRMRPSDVQKLIGSNEKFVKATGWNPEIPFEKTLEDLLDYWREKVERKERVSA